MLKEVRRLFCMPEPPDVQSHAHYVDLSTCQDMVPYDMCIAMRHALPHASTASCNVAFSIWSH